jgi:hypothetical protein
MKDLHFPVIIAPFAQTFPLRHFTHAYMTLIGYHMVNTPKLRRISPIGHLETFSKPNLLNCIMSLSICRGKGGFDAHVWVI